MTLIAPFAGPDRLEWQVHRFGRDSFHYHVMLIPGVDSDRVHHPEWWWSRDDPGRQPAAYWPGRVTQGLALNSDENAFVDGQGRAVWARLLTRHVDGPERYWCTVIGVANPEAKLLDLGDPAVLVTRRMLFDAWHAVG